MTEVPLPLVVIVFGLPGSGKSYFAERLTECVNATYIGSDRIRNEIYRHKTYSDEEKKSVYQTMLSRMKECIGQKKNVILDATFYQEDIRKFFLEETKGNSTLFFIEIVADESVIRDRVEKKRKESDADMEVYKKIKEEWQPLHSPHLVLQSTNDNIQEMLEKAMNYLKPYYDK